MGDGPALNVAQYKRELRDVLCARLDRRRVRAMLAADGCPDLPADIALAIEHLNEFNFPGRVPPEELARPAMEEVAADICECLRAGRWDRLRKTEWGVRAAHPWYYEMSWAGRAWDSVRRQWLNPLAEFVGAWLGNHRSRSDFRRYWGRM